MLTNIKKKSNNDLQFACMEHMQKNEFTLPHQLITNGKIHRFSIDNNQYKPDEWYIAHEGISNRGNHYLICTYGSWSLDVKYTFKSWENITFFNEDERIELEKLLKEKTYTAEQKLLEIHEKVAKLAETKWAQSLDKPPSDHYLRYLKTKGIEPMAIKFGTYKKEFPSIIIPLMNIDGQIRSLQFIFTDYHGKIQKRFLAGGAKKGNFFQLKTINDGDQIYITEGYATGVSVCCATEKATIIAFDAGNIIHVVENIQKKYPHSPITIAGDNDETGISKANMAAQIYGCDVRIPDFSKTPKSSPETIYTDFNDIHQALGISEVKRQLDAPHAIQVITTKNPNAFPTNDDPCSNFNLQDLPPILRDYIKAISETTSAHPIMIASSVYVTISAFAKKKLFMAEGQYFQKLYCNLWMLNITPSGQFKSTALNKGAKLAREKSIQINNELKNLRDKLKDESNNNHKIVLEKEITKLESEDVLFPQKTTPEGLISLLSCNRSGAIFHSEFGGFIKNMDKTHNCDLKAILTDLYDVPPHYRYTTKNSGDFILSEPYFSICATSTTTWLKDAIKDNDVTGGFLARFLIFNPPYQDEIPPALPKQDINFNENTENDIRRILENIQPHSYKLAPSANKLFNDIHHDIHQKIKNYELEVLNPFSKRLSPYILKLAMLNQLFLDPDKQEITPEALMAAMSFILPALKSTVNLFSGELGESPYQEQCRKIYEYICKKSIKNNGPVTNKELISSKTLKGGASAYYYALEFLDLEGKIEWKNKTPHKKDWSFIPKENSN